MNNYFQLETIIETMNQLTHIRVPIWVGCQKKISNEIFSGPFN